MFQRIAPIFLSLFTLLFVLVSCEETVYTDPGEDNGTIPEDTLVVGDTVRYPDYLVSFLPAPGQFVNEAPSLPVNALSIIGEVGFVSLGGFGGYIAVGFNEPIINDASNTYGVDFSIIGNAYDGSSEPGIVMVMEDKNNNGIADEQWYELQGGEHLSESTYHHYAMTYYNTNDSTVTWKNNRGKSGTILQNSYHSQPYYPSADNYPGVNNDSITFTGTRLESKSYEEYENHWVNPSFAYGYADNMPLNSGVELNIPDDPMTAAVEGCGADAFDIAWAVDSLGNSVELDSIYFIKVYCAVSDANAVIGDVSTEIRAIVPVK